MRDATATVAAFRTGTTTARAEVEAALGRIVELDPAVRAFTLVRADEALAEADAVDAGGPGHDGALAGVPIAVKEEYDIAGLPTRLGGVANDGRPAEADSEVIRRLRAAGAIILGTTAMPEFGQFPSSSSARHGRTVNPYDSGRSAGGSSVGSAVAVATGMVPIAMGADGGGSIRIPAAHAGIIGLKPARGRISPAPLTQHWYGLVTLGALTRTVRDTALVMDVVSGSMPTDAWRAEPWPESLSAALAGGRAPLRMAWTDVAILPNLPTDPQVSAALQSTAERIAALGHRVERVTPKWPVPTVPFLLWFGAGMAVEARSVDRPDLLEPRTRHTAALFGWTPPLAPLAARLAAGVAGRIDAVLDRWDVLAIPTVPGLPERADWLDGLGSVRSLLRSTPVVANCAAFNVTGHPAISVPGGRSREGWPIGIQLIARSEATLVRVAAELEADAAARVDPPEHS